MSVDVAGDVASVLDPRLLTRLRARDASDRQVRLLAGFLDPVEHWREEGGAPRAGHRYKHWPGRKADRAPDAGNHRHVNPTPDGPKERARRDSYIVISILLFLRLTPAGLRRQSGFEFKPRSMIATLRGKNWGRRVLRQIYLTAAVCVALDRGYTVAEVVDWLAGWGAPVESRDPVLYFDEEGNPRGEPEPPPPADPSGASSANAPTNDPTVPLLGRKRPGGIHVL